MSSPNDTPSAPTRQASIDTLKGLLIVSVILGHMALGSVDRSLLRYVIYSFHMPLFVGLSGYLFDVDRIAPTVATMVRKYGIRLHVPWMIATCCYVLILGLDPTSLVIPYYHFWYIPAFLGWVALTLLLKRMGASVPVTFTVAAVLSILASLYRMGPDLFGQGTFATHAMGKFVHTLRPQFYVFFACGMLLRGRPFTLPRTMTMLLAFGAFVLTLFLYTEPHPLLGLATFLLFNLALLDTALRLCRAYPTFTIRWLAWLGTNSLGVYLWHALPILLATKLIGTQDRMLYYGACVLGIGAVLFGYAFLANYALPRKYLFGLGAKPMQAIALSTGNR